MSRQVKASVVIREAPLELRNNIFVNSHQFDKQYGQLQTVIQALLSSNKMLIVNDFRFEPELGPSPMDVDYIARDGQHKSLLDCGWELYSRFGLQYFSGKCCCRDVLGARSLERSLFKHACTRTTDLDRLSFTAIISVPMFVFFVSRRCVCIWNLVFLAGGAHKRAHTRSLVMDSVRYTNSREG